MRISHPMLTIRHAGDRGHFDFGWLDTHHTFSFGEYYDPQHMGVRALRVINEDVVHAGGGFGTHPHRDMEIVTYVLSGALGHKDSMGNGSIIRPDDVQRMSAGTGITHSEHNASDDEPVHLLQIWLLPAKTGTAPSYEQRGFPTAARGRSPSIRTLPCMRRSSSRGCACSMRSPRGVMPGSRSREAV